MNKDKGKRTASRGESHSFFPAPAVSRFRRGRPLERLRKGLRVSDGRQGTAAAIARRGCSGQNVRHICVQLHRAHVQREDETIHVELTSVAEVRGERSYTVFLVHSLRIPVTALLF